MIKRFARWLFWGSIGMILYTYIGFPLILVLRSLLRPRPVKRDSSYTPMVSVIIAAHNEAKVITQKLDNIFSANYPRECLEVIVASDGSDDGTNELVAQYNAAKVRLLTLPRQGKNQAISIAATTAQGDILLFTDANGMLTPDALRHLTAPFADSEIGGVGGDYHYVAKDTFEGEGELTYWNYDRIIKQLQSQSGSMSAASGKIYAIRRSLFKPVPTSVTDDFFTAMQVATAHCRFIFEPRAVAYGPIARSAQAEFRRKVRVMSRGLYGVWLVRHLLNPFEYGFFAIQLLSHKLLRRLIVIPLLLLSITAAVLWHSGRLYKLAAMGQLGFHGAAGLGFLLRGTPLGQSKILTLPFYFDLVYTAAAVALINFIRAKRYATWRPERAVAKQGTADTSENE